MRRPSLDFERSLSLSPLESISIYMGFGLTVLCLFFACSVLSARVVALYPFFGCAPFAYFTLFQSCCVGLAGWLWMLLRPFDDFHVSRKRGV